MSSCRILPPSVNLSPSYMDPSDPAAPICRGVTANTDIARIGMRWSIYIQNLLSILYALFIIWDDKVEHQESQFMVAISNNILLIACALLVSSFIQLGMDGYYSIVVLNMSWVNVCHMGVYLLLSYCNGHNYNKTSRHSLWLLC
jgi:hypothetical protein